MPTLFRIVNLLFILIAFFVLSCTTSDGKKSDSVSGPTSEDQVSSSSLAGGSSSIKEASSSSVVVASSITGTSSSSSAGGSSIKDAFSSSVVVASSITATSSSSVAGTSSATATLSSSATGASSTITLNTQTCSYSASGTTNGSTGTLTCADENKTYATVVIGTQTWMAENLAWLPSVNAKSDNSSTVPKYYVYGYDGTSVSAAKANSNYNSYGVLYNFKAAAHACPSGWHLPDTTDWNKLESYVDANNGSKGVGNSLKAVTGWTEYSGIVNSDDFGFNALPGGSYHGVSLYDDNSGGWFHDVGNHDYWWTATASGIFDAWDCSLRYNYANLNENNDKQTNGFSVRCLKDN